jgi:hypothetical protein
MEDKKFIEKVTKSLHELNHGFTQNQLGMSTMYVEIANQLRQCVLFLEERIEKAKKLAQEWDITLDT